jgi:hypothetical protein
MQSQRKRAMMRHKNIPKDCLYVINLFFLFITSTVFAMIKAEKTSLNLWFTDNDISSFSEHNSHFLNSVALRLNNMQFQLPPH